MVVRLQPVAGQHVGALTAPSFHGVRNAGAQPAQHRRVQAAQHRLADAVVVRLDHVRSLSASAPDQTRLRQSRDATLPILAPEGHAGCVGQRLLWQRITCHRNDLEQSLAFRGQSAQTLQDQGVQPKGASRSKVREPILRQHHVVQVAQQLQRE